MNRSDISEDKSWFLCFLEADISQERYVTTIVVNLVSQNPPVFVGNRGAFLVTGNG